MDPGFGLRQPGKDCQALRLDRLRRAAQDDLLDVGQMPVWLVFRDGNLDVGGVHSVAADRLDLHLVAADLQLGQLRLEAVCLQPGIQQRSQKHVPAGAGETINVSDFHS